jgi:hypothetical protein
VIERTRATGIDVDVGAAFRHSANRMPSSSAFSTSSWFRVYDGLSISRLR